jgi:Holliday junction resolvase RusA-like endonuclease
MIKLTLPFATSANHSHHYGSGRKFLSKKTKDFRQQVQDIVVDAKAKIHGTPRLAIFYAVYPPDKRRRDLGNYEKQTTDALMAAGVFEDDSQIDFIWMVRKEVVKGGMIKAVIIENDNVDAIIEHYKEVFNE